MTDCLFRNSIIEHGQRNWEIYYDQRKSSVQMIPKIL
jgi:hypothetical protein